MTRAFLALAVLLAACHPTPQPVPPAPDADAHAPPPVPVPEAAVPEAAPVEAGPADDCELACAHQAGMHCPIAEPSPGGATCAETCRKHTIPGDRWDTQCLELAGSCAVKCGRR